jgi:hypothetical protein
LQIHLIYPLDILSSNITGHNLNNYDLLSI